MPFKTTQQQVPLSLGSTLSWLFTLDLSCPLDFRYSVLPHLPTLTETWTHVVGEGALTMVYVLTVCWGWMTGNALMTNISTLLVFTIPWHYVGSGVVLQSCCGQMA